jgi:hypothetical protein
MGRVSRKYLPYTRVLEYIDVEHGAPTAVPKNTINANHIGITPRVLRDLTMIYGEQRLSKRIPPGMRISALRALIGRTFGISARKRRVLVVDGGGDVAQEVGEGDGARDVGWFISGRTGDVIVE